ncbi:hypothetical protein F4814DRAFT_270331 [Daldinia grandis]|nr:hypothetical protein F4814DRAFT_270331 [Daldinia grandis]
MAQSQHVAAKQRAKRRHQTRSPSPSRHHDWDSRHDPNPHSLPYRPRGPEIHRFAGRNLKIYSHQGAPLSEDDDSDATDPMPHPQQQLARPRSATVGSRNGKGRAVYLEVEDGDDDDEQAKMISRLRSRSRPRTQSRHRNRNRTRTRSMTRSVTSSSGDDETYELSTPPRSTPLYRSRPTSRLPSPSSSRSSSVDTESSDSTEDERLKRRARKRPAQVPRRRTRIRNCAPSFARTVQIRAAIRTHRVTKHVSDSSSSSRALR